MDCKLMSAAAAMGFFYLMGLFLFCNGQGSDERYESGTIQ